MERRNMRVTQNKVRDFVLTGVLRVVSFFALIALFYYVLSFSIMLKVLTMSTTLLYDPKIMVAIYSLLFLMLLISTTLSLTRNLYYADDNKVLLTLPVTGNEIFISKLLASFIYDLQRSIMMFLPVFFAFGLVNGAGGFYYLAVILGVLLTVSLVTVLSALLSIPMLFVIAFLRKNQIIQVTAFAVMLTGIIWGVFYLINLVPENFNILSNYIKYYKSLQNILLTIQNAVGPLYALTLMIVGITERTPAIKHIDFSSQSVLTMLSVFGIIVGAMIVIWFATKPIFDYMAAKQFETNGRTRRKKMKNPTHSSFISQIKSEIISYLREPNKFFSVTVYLFVLPFAVILLNKIFSNINMNPVGQKLAVQVNLLLILLFLMSSNAHAASSLSSEGVSFTMLKTRPIKVRNTIIAKLLIPYLFSIFSLLATVILLEKYANFIGLLRGDIVKIFFIALFANTAHIFWSVDMDITNPQQKNYINGQHITRNPNEIASVLVGVAISFVFFAIAYTLFKDNVVAQDGTTVTIPVAFTKLLWVAVGFMVLRFVLWFVRSGALLRYDDMESLSFELTRTKKGVK
jgi:hypothetical protein